MLDSFETGGAPVSHVTFAPTEFRKSFFASDKYPKEIYLAAGDQDGGISLLRRGGSVIISEPQGHCGQVFQIEFFEGKLISCASDGQAMYWSLDEGARLDRRSPRKTPLMPELLSGAVSPTGNSSIWVGCDTSQLMAGKDNAHAVVIHCPTSGEQTLLPRLSEIVTENIQNPHGVVRTACGGPFRFLVGFEDKVYECLIPPHWSVSASEARDIDVSLPAIEVAYEAIDELDVFDPRQTEGINELNFDCLRCRIPVAGVQRAAVSHDCRFLATASAGGLVQIWDVAGIWEASLRKPERSFNISVSDLTGAGDRAISTVSFTRDDRYVVVGSVGNDVGVWEVASGSHICSAHLKADVIAIDSTNSSDRLLLTFADRVQVRELRTFDLIRELDPEGSITCAYFDRNCERVAAARGDGKIHVWKTGNGELLYVLNHDGVSALRFHPREDRLVTVGKSLMIWDTTLGERLWRKRLPNLARPPYWVNFKHTENSDSRAYSIVAAAKDPRHKGTQTQVWYTAPGWHQLDKLTVAHDREP